jgi:hypothetical protein
MIRSSGRYSSGRWRHFFGICIGVEFAMSAIARVPLEQRAGLRPGMQALIDFGGPLPVVFIGVSLNLGLVVLAIGLLITRAVPRWMSLAITTGASLALVGGLFSNLLGAIGAAGLLVGLGAIGLRTLAGRSYDACEYRRRRDAHIRG